MKKKLLSLALALTMTVSLAACSGGNGGGGEAVDADVPSIDKNTRVLPTMRNPSRFV